MSEFAVPELRVFGFRLTPMTIDQIVSHVRERWEANSPTIIQAQNLHTLYLQTVDPELASSFEQGMAIVDGMPVVRVLGWLGRSVDREHRVTAIDLLGPLLDAASQDGRRVFLVGQKDAVLQAALSELRLRFPYLSIAGHHGFFDPTGPQSDVVVDSANEWGADLILVGMGSPRSEFWLARHRDAIEASVVWTCGALMEYVAGAVPTPPRWAGPMGLEWAFRMAHDPKRFVTRYSIEPILLIARVLIRQLRAT